MMTAVPNAEINGVFRFRLQKGRVCSSGVIDPNPQHKIWIFCAVCNVKAKNKPAGQCLTKVRETQKEAGGTIGLLLSWGNAYTLHQWLRNPKKTTEHGKATKASPPQLVKFMQPLAYKTPTLRRTQITCQARTEERIRTFPCWIARLFYFFDGNSSVEIRPPNEESFSSDGGHALGDDAGATERSIWVYGWRCPGLDCPC